MQSDTNNVFTRDDTFFGVCQAIGEDFGFNPNWLRAALGVLLIWTPVATVAAYVAAGMVIALIRWFVPNPRVAEAVTGEAGAETAPAGENDEAPLAAAA